MNSTTRFEKYLGDYWIEEDSSFLLPVALWKSEPAKKGIAVPAKRLVQRFTSRQECQNFINKQ